MIEKKNKILTITIRNHLGLLTICIIDFYPLYLSHQYIKLFLYVKLKFLYYSMYKN